MRRRLGAARHRSRSRLSRPTSVRDWSRSRGFCRLVRQGTSHAHRAGSGGGKLGISPPVSWPIGICRKFRRRGQTDQAWDPTEPIEVDDVAVGVDVPKLSSWASESGVSTSNGSGNEEKSGLRCKRDLDADGGRRAGVGVVRRRRRAHRLRRTLLPLPRRWQVRGARQPTEQPRSAAEREASRRHRGPRSLDLPCGEAHNTESCRV